MSHTFQFASKQPTQLIPALCQCPQGISSLVHTNVLTWTGFA